MNIFNVHDPDLKVSRSLLIEASAGTGKTYSIENIVVRALIEGKTPPSIRELLVVTFTKAAAKDLKTRIKKCLEAKRRTLTDEVALRRVKQALVEFDQALISTIHAFCFRALAENTVGLKSGPEGATNEIIWEVIEKYFRVGLKGYSPQQLNILLKPHQNSVTDLVREVIALIKRGLPFAKSLTNEEGFSLLKAALKGIDVNLLEIVDTYGACYKGFATREGLPKKEYREVFEGLVGLKAWKLDGAEALQLLSRENQKAKSTVPEKVVFLFQYLQDQVLPVLFQLGSYPALLMRLAEECKKKLFDLYEAKACCDFTYLLHKVEHLASCDKEFQKQLQEQFKMVIIDEFQDTDPLQWKIFHQIFLKAEIPLVLVGDPKQSIYAFRSADIYTYLEAASTLASDSKYVLNTNYRSTPGLICALNHLFQSAPGWMALPYLKSDLPYLPVKSASEKKDLFEPSLEFWLVETEAEKLLFPHFVNEILKLHEKRIPFCEMAFLVRDHAQSDRLFHYFSSLGLPAFQLRGIDFHKAAVLQDFIYLLRAVLSPRNIGQVQAALGTCFFNMSFEKRLELQKHAALASIVASFYAFHHIWKAHGIGPALKEVLAHYSIEERLASTPEGRLRYHELMQILEWLAKKESMEDLSAEACLEELEALQDKDLGPMEELKLRPLAPKNALPILTLHMSKGLEFEAVFALGVMNRPPKQGEIVPVRSKEGIALKATQKNSEDYLNCLKENDAEKARQLYVALTRAKSKLYVPVIEGLKDAGLGGASPIELLFAKIGNFEAICKTCSDIALIKITEEINSPPFIPMPLPSLYPPKKITLNYAQRLSISYSSLTKLASKEGICAPHDFKTSTYSPHTLPAGAMTGELMHELLEKVPLALVQEISDLHPFVHRFVANTAFEPWSEVMAKMIFDAFHTSIEGIKLSKLTEKDLFREIEFMYPLEYASDIPECMHLNGVIKGVIDLFFTYEGKYYLLDWKTNWLGEDSSAYHPAALKQAMLDHRYDLQALIYKRAIQKYLEKVDPRPFQDIFGGVIYHFLRGNLSYVKS